ncbi:MAG: prepilin-type N-terminal cleavage/methylation domain-containing protein [Planctomycetes bacterium]|nr:prepilin-type N-terminal cleavage/methylation domain-containing protein [Planctomycetota bacterium]
MTANSGFTLLELLLAVTLTTALMASAFAAADLFARADHAVIEGDERAVDVDRALRFLRSDFEHAGSFSLGSDQLTIERTDGDCVAWLALATGEELHRIDATSPAELTTRVAVVRALGPRQIRRDGRGHLPDAAWSDTAVLQGGFALTFSEVKCAYDAAFVGLQVRLQWDIDGVRQQRTATMCSLALAEAHAKPPQ